MRLDSKIYTYTNKPSLISKNIFAVTDKVISFFFLSDMRILITEACHLLKGIDEPGLNTGILQRQF